MKNLKFILTLAIILASVCAVSVSAQAQNDKVLVAGKNALRQSDVNALIEFYEWMFETKFTASQRERMRELNEADFRRDAAGSRKSLDDLLNNWSQVKAADAERQRRTREAVLPSFVAELKRTSDNEDSQFLLGVYNAAHPDSDSVAAQSSNSDVTENNNKSVQNASFKNLIGTWVNGRSGSYVTNSIGVSSAGTGSRFTYQFFPDGTVEYTGIMQTVSYGGCKMVVFTQKKGKVSINGDKMSIAFSPAHFSRDDSCDRARNYKKTMPAEIETFVWSLKNKYGDDYFCTVEKNGEESCFSKGK
jgi:hypothetical protein